MGLALVGDINSRSKEARLSMPSSSCSRSAALKIK
jgi:hypothetical protein